jgi:hypothetical protein
MNKDQRNQYVTRDHVIKLLSDTENAKVSNAETSKKLRADEEYLDLTQLDLGVMKASATASTPMGHVLPRSAVHEKTWSSILAILPKTKKAS